jgi:Flp pilus assembly protein TadD
VGLGFQTNRGGHSARAYAAILYGIAKGGRSGVLTVSHDGEQRTLHVLAGRPISFQSTVDGDGLKAALETAGAVPGRQLNWIVSKLEKGETLEDALLNSGALDQPDLATHQRSVLVRGIGAALAWDGGEWAFTPQDDIDPHRIDPALFDTPSLEDGLWRGVVAWLAVDDVLDDVTSGDAGDIALRPASLDGLEAFGLESPLDELAGAIGAGASVGAVLKAVADTSGNLVKLLWLLETVGLISRTGRSRTEDAGLVHSLATRIVADPEPEAAAPTSGQASAPPPGVAPPGPAADPVTTKSEAEVDPAVSRRRLVALRAAAKDPKTLAAAIRSDHAKRMGRVYYEFLGIAPTSSDGAVKSACTRLLRRWQNASRSNAIPADVRQLAEELAKGAALVARTLSDPERRTEYDRRLARGQAPKLEGIRGASKAALRQGSTPGRPAPTQPAPRARAAAPESSDEHQKARGFIKKRNFDAAVPLLQRARRKNPSDPGVLADLGWCVFNATGKAHDVEEGDEFLRLALTFDPNHELALEYLARIAVRGKDKDLAQRRIRKLLGVRHDHPWGRRALKDLADTGGNEKAGGRRFGFWKKE